MANCRKVPSVVLATLLALFTLSLTNAVNGTVTRGCVALPYHVDGIPARSAWGGQALLLYAF